MGFFCFFDLVGFGFFQVVFFVCVLFWFFFLFLCLFGGAGFFFYFTVNIFGGQNLKL